MISTKPSTLLINMPCGTNQLVYPLGLDYLSHSLTSAEIDLTCLDLSLFNKESGLIELDRMLTAKHFDVVGFSLRNLCDQRKGGLLYVPVLKELVALTRQSLKKRETQTLIAVGGAGASLAPEAILEDCGADVIVSGDGETPYITLCNNPHDSSIKGRVISQDSKMKEIAYRRGSWSPIAPYMQIGADGNIQTKRGCNQKCRYCSYPVIEGAAVRVRDVETVAEEFVQLEALGFKKIFIVDGVFNNPPRHAKRVLQALAARKTSAEWTAFFTPKFIDRELLELIKLTNGGKPLKLTIESGSDSVLEALEKGFCAADIIKATELCREMNVPFSFTILFGGPGENNTTVAETCELINRTKPFYVSASIGMYIYPQTPLARLTQGAIWKDVRELMGETIYPVETESIRLQLLQSLAKVDFPLYLHE